ncbi:protein-glutamate O-methyltransferase CheR [Hyphomonas sp. FCG-A18]|jgi:chemotaxis protein methyltransferase CheR|uniref:CheR family methyltransferase n=1 Tax=Hyphomonas sp. FCG-A18 TaxID=3080019 RepID=UPI002B31E924|nr:protein-glutamate O-methyltransferase CheR [Hyphomonas sp. FCG-A18]
MQDTTFEELADLALNQTGQAFERSKTYLMEARLSSICRRESFSGLDDLAHCLKARPNPRFEQEVAAALTGKATRFFRDRATFEQVATRALPARLKQSTNGRLRIWCAGVATGQEAWSLAIRLSELAEQPIGKAQIEIIATEISSPALQTGQSGTYGHYAVQTGLSIDRLMTHFERQDTGDWTLKEDIRDAVTFKRHNLLENAAGLGQFDIILCRNVLSKMAPIMAKRAVENLTAQLLPGGFIFLGADENIAGLQTSLKPSRDMRNAWVPIDRDETAEEAA